MSQTLCYWKDWRESENEYYLFSLEIVNNLGVGPGATMRIAWIRKYDGLKSYVYPYTWQITSSAVAYSKRFDLREDRCHTIEQAKERIVALLDPKYRIMHPKMMTML